MSQYYNSNRKSNLYRPHSPEPFKVSRSKIDLFLECPRCFYLDRVRGVGRPPSYPFNLNAAVDTLLKQEFDVHRAQGTQHPLMEKYGIDAIPIPHEDLDQWRHNFTGIQYLHAPTNLLIFGAIDDLWQNSKGEYIVVDYKATSTSQEISLDDEYKKWYKIQAEFYQWLLRQKGFKVSNTAYFIFCNGLRDKKAFDAKLEFDLSIIQYSGDDSWVEPTILKIKKTLDSDQVPQASPECELCNYVEKAQK